jgi:prevent-host-death family protein
MKEVGIFEAKAKLSEMCNQVEESGAEYVVTRRGRPVARLIRIDPKPSQALGLLDRMAKTEVEVGAIAEDATDFPDVWLERRSSQRNPLED